MHHAFPLGVFWDENNPEIMKWFCVNYNYMFGSQKLDDCCYSYLVSYKNIPFLQKREIFGDELQKYLTKDTIAHMVKLFIDNGNFVEVISDLFYLPVSEAYQLEHYMHEILIVGYDDEKETYIIRDYVNHSFMEIEIEQSKIVPFENGSYYGDDVVIKLYRKREGIFNLSIKAFMLQIRDFYESINPYYRIGNIYGNYFNTWDKAFGFEAYKTMLAYLQSEESIDYRIVRLIQEHFNGMKIKFSFLQKEEYQEIKYLDEMVQFYTRSAINAEEIVLLGVKQTLIQDEDKMRDVKEKVLDELKELIIQEKKVIEKFLEINKMLKIPNDFV